MKNSMNSLARGFRHFRACRRECLWIGECKSNLRLSLYFMCLSHFVVAVVVVEDESNCSRHSYNSAQCFHCAVAALSSHLIVRHWKRISKSWSGWIQRVKRDRKKDRSRRKNVQNYASDGGNGVCVWVSEWVIECACVLMENESSNR